MKRHLKKLLIVSIALFIGCGEKPKDNEYIARVESEYLLRQDIAEFDSNFVRNYVESWINNNLIYTEAIKKGYESDKKIRRMVEEFRKSLIVKNFLQDEILKKAEQISDEEVMNFYQKNQDRFILDRPIVRVGYVKLNSRNEAVALRSKILQNMNFQSMVSNLQTEAGVVEVVAAKYFDQFNVPFPDFWRVSWNLNKGEVSFPVRFEESYFLIYLYDKKNVGDKADFEFIADDVREQAIIEKQNILLDSLITNLKRKYHYEVKW